jgi:hypothetical protein
MPKTISEELAGFGQSLYKNLVELPDHAAITDTLDYILGALHGLVQANQKGFTNRPKPYVKVYQAYLANYALTVCVGHPVLDSAWEAGFYFNSAIQRLAAAFDRLPQMLGASMTKQVKPNPTTAIQRMKQVNPKECKNWTSVYKEVNAFKHRPAGRAAGRTVTMEDAVLAFSEMMVLLADSKTQLADRYGH